MRRQLIVAKKLLISFSIYSLNLSETFRIVLILELLMNLFISTINEMIVMLEFFYSELMNFIQSTRLQLKNMVILMFSHHFWPLFNVQLL